MLLESAQPGTPNDVPWAKVADENCVSLVRDLWPAEIGRHLRPTRCYNGFDWNDVTICRESAGLPIRVYQTHPPERQVEEFLNVCVQELGETSQKHVVVCIVLEQGD